MKPATKTYSKSVKQNKSKGPLSFTVAFFFTLISFFLASNFFFHFTICVSLGMRMLKPMFIDLHCYASTLPGLLSLLPSNAVSTDSLSTGLLVIQAETKKKSNICTTMFVFDFLNAAAEIFLWNCKLNS